MRETSNTVGSKGHKLYVCDTWQFTMWSPLSGQLQEGVILAPSCWKGNEVVRKVFLKCRVQSPFELASLLYQYYTISFEDPLRLAVGNHPGLFFSFFLFLMPALLLPSCVILPKWVKSSFKMGHYPLCRITGKPGWGSLRQVPRRDLALNLHSINIECSRYVPIDTSLHTPWAVSSSATRGY